MNEERLCRGKRLDNGQWAQGYIVEQNTPEYHAYIITDFCAEVDDRHVDILECDIHEVGPDTVGRNTGLKDRNGKRIFEGDVLQFGERRLMVWWNGEDFQWQAKSIRGYDVIHYELFGGWDWTNINLGDIYAEVPITGDMTTEIIGNIHDNPELMEPGRGGENHGKTF